MLIQQFNENINYKCLSKITCTQAYGKKKQRMDNCFIMADTETSKSHKDIYIVKNGIKQYERNDNYIVAWSVAVNVYGENVLCLWDSTPLTFCKALKTIADNLKGNQTVIYIHNLSYDWVFLRKFCFAEWSEPVSQLNTKSHYPIRIVFDNGIEFRDSYILSQRSIEKWGSDMQVEHRKAVGKWDYDKIRQQKEIFNNDEILYIVNDVLCGVECLEAMRKTINKSYRTMPYTATGIVRAEAKKRGGKTAHEKAKNSYTTLEQLKFFESIYHGGYTHANRHYVGFVHEGKILAYDFASSYPYCMLSEKFPIGKFAEIAVPNAEQHILKYSGRDAFIFGLRLMRARLKNLDFPMPLLQVSKCKILIDAVCDNGRILECGYCDIPCNDVIFQLIRKYYDWEDLEIYNLQFARKEYLPRWLTDYVFELYKKKTTLKSGDPVLYAISKSMLNSVYGMCVQKMLKDDIKEDYMTGEYLTVCKTDEETFEKKVKSRSNFLYYPWGLYVTSYAMKNLFELGECVGIWLYSDTDSCYGMEWDEEKVNQYNKKAIDKIKLNGYAGVEHNGKTYHLGVAEKDGEYSKFITLGAKRYAVENDVGIKITIAGVPKKKGSECLRSLTEFKRGFIFKGELTGKKTHTYNYVDDIYIDDNGNYIADSINLVPCDYLLDETIEKKIERLGERVIEIQRYEE